MSRNLWKTFSRFYCVGNCEKSADICKFKECAATEWKGADGNQSSYKKLQK